MLSNTLVLIFMVSSEVLKTRNKEISKCSLLNTEKKFKDIKNTTGILVHTPVFIICSNFFFFPTTNSKTVY